MNARREDANRARYGLPARPHACSCSVRDFPNAPACTCGAWETAENRP